MMWHEEHLWNVSVLQRVHRSNLVNIALLSILHAFSWGFMAEILYEFLISYVCYMPYPSYTSWFNQSNIIWRKLNIMKLLIV
jgi:hypothetical protein